MKAGIFERSARRRVSTSGRSDRMMAECPKRWKVVSKPATSSRKRKPISSASERASPSMRAASR
jgi:hypothetical protein